MGTYPHTDYLNIHYIMYHVSSSSSLSSPLTHLLRARHEPVQCRSHATPEVKYSFLHLLLRLSLFLSRAHADTSTDPGGGAVVVLGARHTFTLITPTTWHLTVDRPDLAEGERVEERSHVLCGLL